MGRRLAPPLFYTGRDPDFQKVQRTLARQDMLARLADGYELYPEKYKPNGVIAQRALMMMGWYARNSGKITSVVKVVLLCRRREDSASRTETLGGFSPGQEVPKTIF